MWKRSDLKQRAKTLLKKDYWKAFLVSLVMGLAAGGGSGGSGSGFHSNFDDKDNMFKNFDFTFTQADIPFLVSFLVIAGLVVVGVVMFAFAIRVFLGNPLEVGGRRYFIKTAEGQDNHLCFTFAFGSGHYMKIVLAMLLRGVQNFLWYLLFIIPGIVKSYEYRMVPYILAENPHIGAQEAILASRRMTDGSKFKMFLLDLSFLGWYILGILACFIGVLFLQPYIDMTMAELYVELRNEALSKGIVKPSDLAIETAPPVLIENRM
jgi:uncharacterized membrane protein